MGRTNIPLPSDKDNSVADSIDGFPPVLTQPETRSVLNVDVGSSNRSPDVPHGSPGAYLVARQATNDDVADAREHSSRTVSWADVVKQR